MPVDYSLLGNPQTPSKVIGPASNQPSIMEQLGQGLTKGVQNYQAAAQNTQRMQENSNILAQQKQQAVDAQGLRDAAQQGSQQAIDFLMKTDPIRGFDLQNKIANLDKTRADIGDTLAKTQKETHEAALQGAITLGGIADQANAAEKAKPGSGDQVYQAHLNMLPPATQELLKTPDANGHSYAHFTPETNVALHAMALQAQAETLEKQQSSTKDTRTTLQKNVDARDQAQDSINKAVDAGKTPDPKDVNDLQAYNEQLNKANTGSNNPYNKALADSQTKQLTGMEQQTQALQVVHDDAKDALNVLSKVPAGYTGPIVDYLKANGMNSDVQKLQKLTSGIPIAVKAMYGVTPGNRLTTTELEQLNKASGSTAINRDALSWVLNRLIPQTEGIIHQNWKNSDSIVKNADPKYYNNWQSSHPEPTNPFDKDYKGQSVPKAPEGRVIVYDKSGKAVGHIPNNPDQINQAKAQGYTLKE